MEFNKEKEVSYWDSFYSNSDQKNLIPSQFAVFAISEMNDHSITFVVECGAGNGRDSFFFCSHGKTVLSLDRSSQAVENISKTAENFDKLIVAQHDVKNAFPDKAFSIKEKKGIYARFFLHSLDKVSLEKFFKNASDVMNKADLLFVEYRNQNDSHLPKVTDTHYREYYTSLEISEIAKNNNLSVKYEVSGVGFAKYKHDDAFITRQIFYKN